MICYLAQPYSVNSDESIRERRYQYALKKVAEYMNQGYNVFSPILNSHMPAVQYGLPNNWEFWKKIDKEYIAVCGELWVLKMKDWDKSVGVEAELAYAMQIGLPITFIECPDEFEELNKVA